MRKIKFIGVFSILRLLIVIPALIIIKLIPTEVQYKTVKISGETIKAEIADTTLKRIEGLMSKKTLPDNQGMLFIFNDEGHHGIWMMNTSIHLDIIWIDSNHKIIDIVKNAQPCFLICEIYTPDKPARYVLEVNAGFTDRNSVKIGSVVKF